MIQAIVTIMTSGFLCSVTLALIMLGGATATMRIMDEYMQRGVFNFEMLRLSAYTVILGTISGVTVLNEWGIVEFWFLIMLYSLWYESVYRVLHLSCVLIAHEARNARIA